MMSIPHTQSVQQATPGQSKQFMIRIRLPFITWGGIYHTTVNYNLSFVSGVANISLILFSILQCIATPNPNNISAIVIIQSLSQVP